MKKLLVSLVILTFTQPSFASSIRHLKIAMSAAFVSERGVGVYEEISDYLGKKLNIKSELISGLSYETINEMIADGAVHIGFVCGLPYVLLKQKKVGIELIGAPVMNNPRYGNKPIYYSDLIVHKDSTIKSISELKGKKFVYNESISNSGYNLPRYFFLSKNYLGKHFFGATFRSGSHEESIKMVALKKHDYSFVDSLVLEYDMHYGFGYAKDVKVIKSIGPSASPPIIASSKMPGVQREDIKRIFLNMHLDPIGRKILEKALVKKIVSVRDKHYDDIRNKYLTAAKSESLEIK